MSRISVDVEGALRIYTAAEAALVMQTTRAKIDAACESGALRAVDDKLPGSRSTNRRWRIRESSLTDWDDAGRPILPERAP